MALLFINPSETKSLSSKNVLPPNTAFTLSFVKYKLVDPSLISSVSALKDKVLVDLFQLNGAEAVISLKSMPVALLLTLAKKFALFV